MYDFMKMCRVGAELFHADGWTNMTKLIVAFRNFVNAPTNDQSTSSDMIPEITIHRCRAK
jgi:hypothetical protein